MKLASRTAQIEPFYVMEVAKAAAELSASPLCDPARGGREMLHLHIGEPDRTALPAVVQAAEACLNAGRTQYTHATGLPALRQALSRWYAARFGLDVDPARIVITAGASAALQLAMLALVEPGDAVLMPDPSYPCNRHFVTAAGGQAQLLPCGPDQRFQPSAEQIHTAWTPATRGVVLASPSNPTGTSVEPAELAKIVQTVRQRGGFTVVDEIYLGLSYEERFGQSALALGQGLGQGVGEDVISVNSFSKYFGMTGWRLGWLVLPPAMVEAVERLAQNLYICASSVAQEAALACFEPDSIAQFEDRRAGFRERRDFIVPALQRLGFEVPVVPDGAFYVWADVSRHSASSWDLCFDLMRRAQVTLTPGRDFGPAFAERYLRLSFASSMDTLHEAVARLEQALA